MRGILFVGCFLIAPLVLGGEGLGAIFSRGSCGVCEGGQAPTGNILCRRLTAPRRKEHGARCGDRSALSRVLHLSGHLRFHPAPVPSCQLASPGGTSHALQCLCGARSGRQTCPPPPTTQTLSHVQTSRGAQLTGCRDVPQNEGAGCEG